MDLAERRAHLAALLTAALPPGVPVYAAVPAGVTPPCVLVTTGAATAQSRLGHWDAEHHVTVIGPPGDNEAAADHVDALLLLVALALSEGVGVPVLWDRPAGRPLAGGTFLAAELTVQTRVTVTPEVEPHGQ